MTIPKNFSSFSGKENLITSFNKWITSSILGGQISGSTLSSGNEFFWSFDYPILPQRLPAISVTELGLFNLGEEAFDRFLGYDNNGNEVYGARNQTLIEISCLAEDSETFTESTRVVRNLRDRVIQALHTIKIPLKDYSNPLEPQIGIIELDAESNAINEKFLVDPANQNLKRYVIIVRVFWTEFENRSKSYTIESDAQIL